MNLLLMFDITAINNGTINAYCGNPWLGFGKRHNGILEISWLVSFFLPAFVLAVISVIGGTVFVESSLETLKFRRGYAHNLTRKVVKEE
jgi:hypothetical protein